MPDPLLLSRFVLGPTASLCFSIVVGLGACAALVAVAVANARRSARLAEQAARGASAPLRPGRILVEGTVEADAGPVVELAIDERGREMETDHGVRHLWTERRRRVSARPFVLVLDGGERIAVLADERTILDAPLSATRAVGPAERTRIASIGAGARVWVDGVLRRGDGLVIGAARPLGRLIVATAPPERFHRERAAFHRGFATRLALLFVGLQLFAFGRFWALRFAGHVVEAPIGTVHAYQTAERSGLVWHWAVAASWAAPEGSIPLEDEVSEAFYDEVTAAQRKHAHETVRFVVLRGFPEVQSVGTRATIERSTAWEVSTLLALVALAYGSRSWRTRPRHASPRVVEPGRGPLVAMDEGDARARAAP
jgi:hypothetical protein